MTQRTIPGLHHVTAISGPPQQNVDFFTKLMGQRLVKKTVNFDDPGTYHLYYGNKTADPGTILTFFPFADAGPGRTGPGMASAYAYSVEQGAFGDWIDRLADQAVDFGGPEERFGERMITVADPDGAKVELIEVAGDQAPHLDGFHSATLWLDDIGPTHRLMTDVMGYVEQGYEAKNGEERTRLRAPGDARGAVIDLMRKDASAHGRSGTGTIPQIAFRARDAADQLEWRDRLLADGQRLTPVIDRQYFNAIYFREPGGVLFEIATDPPGFTRDEPLETLGQSLILPEQYEGQRSRLEKILPEIAA